MLPFSTRSDGAAMTSQPKDFLAHLQVLWSDGVTTTVSGALIGFNDVLVPTSALSRGAGLTIEFAALSFGDPPNGGYGFNPDPGSPSAVHVSVDRLSGDAFAVLGFEFGIGSVGGAPVIGHAEIAGADTPIRASYDILARTQSAGVVAATIPGDAQDGADGWAVPATGALRGNPADPLIHAGAPVYLLNDKGETVIAGIGINTVPADAAELLRIQPLAALHDEIGEAVRANDMMIEGLNTRAPIYRFLNTENGAHFYTADSVERNAIDQTLDQFVYEGISFGQPETPGIEVHRFFNTVEGGHFFTTSAIERDVVINTLPQYRYEGVGFQSVAEGGENALAVHRFYDTATGGHFFTADEAEKDAVIADLPQYRYEGVGFWMTEI